MLNRMAKIKTSENEKCQYRKIEVFMLGLVQMLWISLVVP